MLDIVYTPKQFASAYQLYRYSLENLVPDEQEHMSFREMCLNHPDHCVPSFFIPIIGENVPSIPLVRFLQESLPEELAESMYAKQKQEYDDSDLTQEEKKGNSFLEKPDLSEILLHLTDQLLDHAWEALVEQHIEHRFESTYPTTLRRFGTYMVAEVDVSEGDSQEVSAILYELIPKGTRQRLFKVETFDLVMVEKRVTRRLPHFSYFDVSK